VICRSKPEMINGRCHTTWHPRLALKKFNAITGFARKG
jgi:hypothetical protein